MTAQEEKGDTNIAIWHIHQRSMFVLFYPVLLERESEIKKHQQVNKTDLGSAFVELTDKQGRKP